MNHIVEDYLLELRTRLSSIPLKDRDGVLAEVRAHLAANMEDHRRSDPSLSDDELALAATTAFGDPDEIAVAFGPQGGLVRKETGEVLVPAATVSGRAGRKGRRKMKWAIIAGAILLIGALAASLTGLYFTGVKLAQEVGSDSAKVYYYIQSIPASSPQTVRDPDSFDVPVNSREFRITFGTSPQTGCLGIELTSPSGVATSVNGDGCLPYQDTLVFTETGTWKVQYTYVAFSGSVTAVAEAYFKA